MDSRVSHDGKGWIFYDGECAFCIGWVNRVKPVLEPRGFRFAALQESWVCERLQLSKGAPLMEMVLLKPDGQSFGGGDAVIELARAVWWAWPLYLAAHLPGARWLIGKVYARIAAHRHCLIRQ